MLEAMEARLLVAAVNADSTTESSAQVARHQFRHRRLLLAMAPRLRLTGVSAQSVTFAGTTGTLKLDDAVAFTGQVSGLAGSDAIDLADVSYGPSTQATFLGNDEGGTLTVTTGRRRQTSRCVGDYLSSNWTCKQRRQWRHHCR